MVVRPKLDLAPQSSQGDAGPYVLGIDIGTSGLKCALVDARGRVAGTALVEYRPDTPRPGWAEQDPDTWSEAAVVATRRVLEDTRIPGAAVRGIGLSGQMHSTVFLDTGLRPTRPAILWLDQRSAALVHELQQQAGTIQLGRWIGNPIAPGFMVSSLLWVRRHEPTVWAATDHVLLPKDYVRLRLTGVAGTDFSDASATGLLDVEHRAWSAEMLDATGLPRRLLPEPDESTAVAGGLRGEAAQAMGLPAGIPVVTGAGDQEAQAIGNGILRPGTLSSTIGTGGQLFAPTAQYRYDPSLRLHTFCHAAPGLWHLQAATLTAGLGLRWLRDEVFEGRYGYQELADAAATVAPGAEGLTFLPYLGGERTPHMDPAARGVFFGLTLRHTWRHLVRAVMEGVVFSLRDGLDLMRNLGVDSELIVASGGATHHPLWLRLQADILGASLRRTATEEAAALGAALLAGTGTGLFRDLDQACDVAVRWLGAPLAPDPGTAEVYDDALARFRGLYPALQPAFARTASTGDRSAANHM